MIMAQIESFFQLYHLIDWGYVINLSVEHYPLKSTKAIYQTFQKNPGASLFAMPKEEHMERLVNPLVQMGQYRLKYILHAKRHWPFK
jgi:Core-2/I-Branching enzyme